MNNIINETNFPEFEYDTLPWIDKNNFNSVLGNKIKSGHISSIEAGLLRKIRSDGYMILPRLIDDQLIDNLLADYQRLWLERPPCLVRYNNTELKPISELPEKETASKNFRINDFHNISDAAAEVIMHSGIVRIMELIFADYEKTLVPDFATPVAATPVAMQSLYFEYGSQQGAHQDFVYVPADILSHLAAAWVALEDISLEQGPLLYYPESHRIKKYDFGGGCLTNIPGQEQAWCEHMKSEISRLNLKEHKFIAKKGDVLIWHGALLHGGCPIIKPELTRNSIVVHYSSRRAYTRDYRDKSRAPEMLHRNGAAYYKWDYPEHIEGRYKLKSINNAPLDDAQLISQLLF